MVAIYPAAVKKFSYRQDYTELVEAADVNVSYDEIAATQTTLGVLPNTDTIDGAVNTWSTVGNRISAVRAGVSKPYVTLSAHNFQVPYSTRTSPAWTSVTWDTHGMYGGSNQVVCKRSGVYTFDIYTRWHKDSLPADNQQPVFNRNGELQIFIQSNGTDYNIVNQGGFFPIGWQRSTHQSASITQPWYKGQALTMIHYQSCLTTPIIATSICAITYHRDPPTKNNL
jgi:hypothetical protein